MSHPYGPPSYHQPPTGPLPMDGFRPQPMRNGLGVAALVLGILGALIGVVPFLFIVAGTLGLLAVIFGFVGRARATRRQASNGGMALAGAILGIVAMAGATWGVVRVVLFVDSTVTQAQQEWSSTYADPADPAPESGAALPTATPTKAPKPLKLGAIAREEPFSLKILSTERKAVVSNSIGSHKAQGSYAVVRILVKNTGDAPASFDAMDAQLLDADGKVYVVDSDATISQNLGDVGLYDPINPSQKITRVLVFDLPKKATPLIIGLVAAEGSTGSFMYLR